MLVNTWVLFWWNNRKYSQHWDRFEMGWHHFRLISVNKLELLSEMNKRIVLYSMTKTQFMPKKVVETHDFHMAA